MGKKEGKKHRKYGRNADWCKAYRARGQREKNKIKKVLRHILRYGATDHMAVHYYNNLPHFYDKPVEYRSITPVKREGKVKAAAE